MRDIDKSKKDSPQTTNIQFPNLLVKEKEQEIMQCSYMDQRLRQVKKKYTPEKKNVPQLQK